MKRLIEIMTYEDKILSSLLDQEEGEEVAEGAEGAEGDTKEDTKEDTEETSGDEEEAE